ncbi:Rho GTPase-activating protein REN1-like protein [Tanacetum coccineum]
MPNNKAYNVDSKNNTGDSKNNNVDMKMNRAESKNNKVDWKHNHSDVKSYSDSKNNTDVVSQGDVGGDHISHSSGVAQPPERHYSRQFSHNGNKVYKSGPLFLSSKGIGWTSWKKRWFILTETSLVFFRSDPSAAPQKGGEANLTLGGIDLNSSGSVVMKADKKLITVLFPDGHDGRAFTLKAETSEDLFEWKDALVLALSNAPSAVTVQGQNGISKNDKDDTADGFHEQFEDYGVNVEGILRQAADVDDVERRIREYEQGKTEFGEDEDGHVIGDCIKFVLRELPSPPVPASCCAALLEAYKTDRATRASAIRSAICDTFPEPNRRLLQRILIMMEAVAENKAVNRMSVSAVAACMSPLLLRPLLAGEVELDKGSDMGGDGSVQLLQAAAAANHAQAICITLVEEYDKIFGEEDMLSDLYSDSDDYDSESGSDEYYEEDEYSEDDDDDNNPEGSSSYEEESEHGSSSSYSESEDDDYHTKGSVSSNELSNHSKDSVSRKKTIKKRISVKKGSPLEHIAYITEQQAEIVMLESNKAKLKERIEAEARRNAILKEDLVSKKKALEMRRVDLLEEVSRLEEELQKIPLPDSTDEKVYPEEVDQSEAGDPGLQHNQSHEQNSDATRDSSNQQPLSPDHEIKKDKEKDRETTAASHRIKVANTTSALSKITNRLNFLKERRNQISDDLQDTDKDHKNHKHRGSKKWSESTQVSDESQAQSSDKGKGSDTHSQSQKESSNQQRDNSMDKGRSDDQSR